MLDGPAWKEQRMCCDQLACARCTRPVADGGCASCRAARAELHGSSGPSLSLLLALVLLVALAGLLSSGLAH